MKALGVLAIVVFATTAGAAITTNLTIGDVVETDGTPYAVCEMVVTSTSDWTNSVLGFELTAGSFYNHPAGGHTEPNPSFFEFFPDLQWDTYATTPAGYPRLASFAPAPQMDDTAIHVSWYDMVDDGPVSQAKIAQMTLSLDATGHVSGKSFEGGTVGGVPFDAFLPPLASLVVYARPNGPYTIGVGEVLTLDARGSLSGQVPVASYLWDLDDNGSFETDAGTAALFDVPYADLELLGLGVGGPRDIHLQLTNALAETDTGTTQLIITPEPATGSLFALAALALPRRRRRSQS